jgi:hypothetical protein
MVIRMSLTVAQKEGISCQVEELLNFKATSIISTSDVLTTTTALILVTGCAVSYSLHDEAYTN